MNELDFLIAAQKKGEPRGLVSICSAHPWVLKAAMQEGNGTLLLEATCNQVNQFGGYIGMTPMDFVAYARRLAQENAFPLDQLLLGGDHLGPNVWQGEPAASAMPKALDLVRDYVRAGFTKIHLDASMRLADDAPGPLPPEIVARRAAQMVQIAEANAPDVDRLRYVIGTEVPVAGGAQQSEESVQVTRVEDVRQTIEITHTAFAQAGMEAAWERVRAVVVQPGVEYGDDFILDYQPDAAHDLATFIETEPGLVYEAHSTDYQTPDALQHLVRDHFAILKVGPALTFALREAVFALSHIEKALFSAEDRANVPQTLEAAMLRQPGYWQKYYSGTLTEQAFKRQYSLSDRIRYYWTAPEVQTAFARLLHNLGAQSVPLSLVSQYFPDLYEAIRVGELPNRADRIILARVEKVLRGYRRACEG
ncbi:MAG TPA: D-tagatose-bisphosphate aldolase, class II, non-catalytic subunit [Anaerolineales bacterium]|nr:D-tagatose-bisphosphate aldolase, class II, non-catalytic subunit [Anaerolineales bacterium]